MKAAGGHPDPADFNLVVGEKGDYREGGAFAPPAGKGPHRRGADEGVRVFEAFFKEKARLGGVLGIALDAA